MLDVIATITLVVSVLVLAMQTREQAKQTAIANDLAREEALRHAMRSIDAVSTLIVEHPELRPFFREGAIPRENDRLLRGQVEEVAELMVEALQTAIRANDMVGDGPEKDDLEAYARHVFASSPTVDALLAAHPDWWPRLASVRRGEFQSTAAPQPGLRGLASRLTTINRRHRTRGPSGDPKPLPAQPQPPTG